MTGQLDAGEAQKLAGRLSWATQLLFHKLGRAMIRPLFDQKRTADGAMSEELVTALTWWLNVLDMDLCEERAWAAPVSPVVHLLVRRRFCHTLGG